MILVVKPPLAPPHLNRGDIATVDNCAAFDADSLSFVDGSKAFEFDNSIYGHVSVKSQLKAAQHGKCCYCESEFSSTSPGDVEHFRPKKGARQGKGAEVEHPGYYWLAYSWKNLYFSCTICNGSYKKSYFPLRRPSRRARIHSDNIEYEEPLLLDPGGPDDPSDHIKFHDEVPIGTTEKGRRTIEVLKLDRESLNMKRRTVVARVKECKELIEAFDANPAPQFANVVASARRYLEDAVKPTAEYSALALYLLCH